MEIENDIVATITLRPFGIEVLTLHRSKYGERQIRLDWNLKRLLRRPWLLCGMGVKAVMICRADARSWSIVRV